MMDRKRIEHQLTLDLEAIMTQHVGQMQSPGSDDRLRTIVKHQVESYLCRMFHFGSPALNAEGEWVENPLPVEYVSTTTPREVALGYMTFEFRERKTGKVVKDSAELLRLLGLP